MHFLSYYELFNRITLQVLSNRALKRSLSATATASKYTNWQFLSPDEIKAKAATLQKKNNSLQMKIKHLNAALIQHQGVVLDDRTSSDLVDIMKEEGPNIMASSDPHSFRRIFWQQQQTNLSRGSKGFRWHPLMIRWCLYLHHQSSKAYNTLRDSGIITLPSERTLRDYSNCTKARPGYSHDVDMQLFAAAKMSTCHDWQKLIILLLDEMYIKESIVYNKNTGEMIGFVDLGEINNHLMAFEHSLEEADDISLSQNVAKTMLVIMVKGLL